MLGHLTDSKVPGGLVRRELPEPAPASDHLVVEVRAYAVNRGELVLLAERKEGWTPGQDVSGVVVREAANGRGPKVGTRVVALADQGGWSERVAVPVHRVAPLPDPVSFAQAASLPVAGLTALRALREGGPLLGRRVLVTGASGGVGHFAVQLAKVAGAQVTAQVSGPARFEAAQRAGADEVTDKLGDRHGPFDLVVDGVGGPVLVEAIHRLAKGATAVSYGLAAKQPSTLSFIDFAQAPLARLVGFFVYATDEQSFGEDLGFLARLIGEGRLHPELTDPRDWSETLEAVTALRKHQVTGKAVLTIAEAK